MMKKLIYCAAALATALFAGSCQRELLETLAGETTVTYTVELPSVETKAATTDENRWIGDGNNVDQLIYQIWKTKEPEDRTLTIEEGKTYLLTSGEADVENGKAKFSVDLVNKQNYTILFWAQVKNTRHYNTYNLQTTDLRNIEMISNTDAFDESRAAFFGTAFIKKDDVRKAKETVILRRPFGQINLGTVIKTQGQLGYSLSVTNTEVTVYDVATEFNVATGTTLNENQNLTFAAVEPGKYKQEYPNSDKLVANSGEYNWISMNYVFVPANKANIKVGYKITTNHGLVENTISNVPAQINYKTNIVGNLLTSKTEYEVILDNTWNKPDKEAHVVEADNIQTVLDNAVAGTTIQLKPGVNYGTLVFRQNASSKVVDITDAGGDALGNEKYRKIEDLTIVGAEGAVIDGFDFQVGWIDGSGASYIDVKNLTVEGVTFSGKKTPFNFEGAKGSALGIDGLTIVGCKMNDEDGTDRFVFQQISGYKELSDKTTNEYVMTTGIKNLTITECEVTGAYMVIESRAMENLTITNNTFKGIKARDMLITSDTTYYPDKTYTGNITITENTSIKGEERFIRGSLNNSDAVVVIKDNNIINYMGADADYIKVTGGNKVTIKNNSISYSTIPAEVNLVNGETVTLPDAEADYTVVVKGEGTLVLDGTTITSAEGPAIELAEGANVTLRVINGNVNITGATNGIQVPNSAELTVTGEGSLNVLGKAGSGIGYASTSEKTNTAGKITISNLSSLTAKGTGEHAYGIGSKASHVRIEKSTINYACGGHIQPTFINDTKYGKSEPEGAPAIGGEKIDIVESIIEKADGGSKAAAIGAKFWQSTSIEIVNSTIEAANGGNASAGIGGSRYAEGDKYNVSIKIQKSTVTATGGQHGAGIGSGYDTHCNGQDYSAKNHIEIDAESVINAKGGKYAAGIGTGYHSAYLTGSIAIDEDDTAESGDNFYKEEYTKAQNIGYGVVDPAREFSGDNAEVTFEVNGKVIEYPYERPVAKVGNTEYTSIDEAIANWTNGTTLTLIANVTLSDVVSLKSTEHHILNLGTYTLTAASGQNAIEITCEGRSSASYALTINADAENPGGITATGKACIYYNKSGSTKDRPIILINNGVFTGSYSINSISNGNTNCPQIWINGGVFNSYMNLTKNMLRVSGGTFHGAINCTGDSSAYREIKGGRFKSWQFMTADAPNKFWVGSGNGNYNVGVYVDNEGYLVVGGPVITELSAEYPAVASNYSKWSNYLKYSSAATYGLFYKDSDMAIAKHGAANVTVYDPNANKDEE